MQATYTILCLSVLVAVSLAAIWREDSVVSFQIYEEDPVYQDDLKLFNMLMSPNGPFRANRLGTYSFKNCADPKVTVLNITKLVFSPDPLTFPGTFYVTVEGAIKQTLSGPLKTMVTLEKKVGSTWIKIPCIGEIGSCTYDDLCQVLSGAVCPPPFVANKIPCKCPFTQGNYTLNNAGFEVDGALFPSGDYHAKATMTTGSTLVGCIDVYASFD